MFFHNLMVVERLIIVSDEQKEYLNRSTNKSHRLNPDLILKFLLSVRSAISLVVARTQEHLPDSTLSLNDRQG